jgi:hypothetical protein
MARTTQASAPATAPEPKAPDFIAWHVSNRGEKAFWTKVGAAWSHRDRKDLSLQLEVVPINGRIVLRTPLDDEAKEVKPGAQRPAMPPESSEMTPSAEEILAVPENGSSGPIIAIQAADGRSQNPLLV